MAFLSLQGKLTGRALVFGFLCGSLARTIAIFFSVLGVLAVPWRHSWDQWFVGEPRPAGFLAWAFQELR